MKKLGTVLGVLLGAMLVLVLLCAGVAGPCWTGWVRWGVLPDHCPVGVLPYAESNVYGLGRELDGTVNVSVWGQTYDDALRPYERLPMHRASVKLVLQGDAGPIDLAPVDGWTDSGPDHSAVVRLPKELADGDYTLLVTADTPAGQAVVKVPVPVYRPALAHTLTNAPLYKPGQTLRFRALLLARGSLEPIAGRPGTWVVTSPDGTEVLREKGRTDAQGVAASDLPLADDAPAGTWTVRFESGGAADPVGVEVRTFTLPRMTVDVAADARSWARASTPTLHGHVRYASGAPVAGGSVRLRLSTSGAWQPPPEWPVDVTLPTDSAGAFSFTAAAVPADLVGTVTMAVRADATDPAGESATGSTSLVLAEDRLHAEAVTELGDGMVPEMNNRLYVRLTTPEGAPLADTAMRLRPAWDDRAAWTDAKSDADGVVRLQLDPGSPVTVTEPPIPVRPSPQERHEAVRVSDLEDELRDEPGLADRGGVDRWARTLADCAQATTGSDAGVSVRAAFAGSSAVYLHAEASDASAEAVASCVRGRLGALHPASAGDHLWSIELQFGDPGTARLDLSSDAVEGDAEPILGGFVAATRACAARLDGGTELPIRWFWTAAKGSTTVRVHALRSPSDDAAATAAASCAAGAGERLYLAEPAEEDAAGVLTASVVAADGAVAQPPPVTWPGFDFLVAVDGRGTTHLRLHVGQVPALRLRFDEVIVDAGAKVGLTAVRGPDFSGGFPDELELRQGDVVLTKFKFDGKARTGSFTVPTDASGFASVEYAGARAILFIRPKAHLQLDLTASGTWKPGSQVTLTARAHDGEAPVPDAGVSLVGVDATMQQLAPLPAPDDFSRVTTLATMDGPAFGALDVKALQAGLIRGDAAQQATVLRIASFADTSSTVRVDASGQSLLDVETPLTEAFYGVYAEARHAVHAWETSAPPEELLTNDKMAELWKKALAAHPAEDPFGRSLRLGRLPQDLLALTAPQVMVDDAARLPEDIDNWSAWVAKENP